jgi:transcriptional regulator with XRE-family HTH domain
MDIGTKIRKLRESKGFTQEYMAMHLAISQSKYCNIESNKTSIDFEVLLKVAALLQTDLKEFIPEKYNFLTFRTTTTMPLVVGQFTQKT